VVARYVPDAVHAAFVDRWGGGKAGGSGLGERT
jgi:hypothetical protein